MNALLVAVLAIAVAGAVLSARPSPRPGANRDALGAMRHVHRSLATRSAAARRAAAIEDDVPDVVGMLSVAVAAGCNVRLAIEAVIAARDGPVSDAFAAALRRVDTGAARLADALADLASRGTGAAAATTPSRSPPARVASITAGVAVAISAARGNRDRTSGGLRALAALLADAERYGMPLGPALDRLADELRQRRRREAEAEARRLPVRLLVPLVCCVLPAFALLTVAPLLVSGIDALTAHPEQHETQELP